MQNRNKNKLLRMQNLRRVVQVLAFIVFISLFIMTIGQYDAASGRNILAAHGPVDIFFQLDPLLGLSTMLAIRRAIPEMLICGLPVIILTILMGRFFCGWICPMGTTLDAADTVFYKKRRRVSALKCRNTDAEHAEVSGQGCPETTGARNIKYYILGAIFVAAIFASQVAYLFDPITIITRTLTFVAYPAVTLLTHAFTGIGISVQSPFIPQDVQYFFRANFVMAVIFVGIIAANSISRRYWCRNLCPLGALLGVLGKFSIIKRVVKPDCISCKKCIPDCKMGAIKDDPAQYQAPECIYCYSCTNICPTLSTSIVPTIHSEGHNTELDLTRRRTLQAMGIGAFAAVLGKTNLAAKKSRTGNTGISSSFLLRPPGAVPEEQFMDRCIRCSECMKVCPTNGLQPALTEAGIEGLWTPVLVPRVGECTRQCNLCGQVCATDAIRPFKILEKDHIYIGRAVIDRSQCIAWNSDKQCLVCDECCSYHAVHWKTVDGIRRPFVDEHKCVGCGICENVCPIQPTAAIRVYSLGDQRNKSREEQKRFFEQSLQNDNESSTPG